MNLHPATLDARDRASIPHRPKGCNGWWHKGEKALMHGPSFCPIHDADDAERGEG